MNNLRRRPRPLRLTPDVRSRLLLVALSMTFLLPAIWSQAQAVHDPSLREQPKSTAAEYVGSRTCAGCHQDIYRRYQQTGMGRSMSLVSQEWLKTQQTSGSVADKKNQVQFDVYPRDGKLYRASTNRVPTDQRFFLTPTKWNGSSEPERMVLGDWSGAAGPLPGPAFFYPRAMEPSPDMSSATRFQSADLPACIGATVDAAASR
jgi:hypothetical protein